MRIIYIGIALMSAYGSQLVAEVFTPAPGSSTRTEILDAVRVPAINGLGAPIEFHVRRLDVDGHVGFVRVTAMRPGSVPIDLSQIPLLLRDGHDDISSTNIEAFVKRVDGRWDVTTYVVDPTDVWWIGPPYCTDYSTLLPPGACS